MEKNEAPKRVDPKTVEEAILNMTEKEFWLWHSYPHERMFYFPHLVNVLPNGYFLTKDDPV